MAIDTNALIMPRLAGAGLGSGAGPGLDKIVRGAPAPQAYGRSENLSPSELQTLSVLDQLFELPDIDDFILQSLQPQLSDVSLLQPQPFAKALAASPAQLRTAADADPSLALKLGRSAGVMQHTEALRRELYIYISALLQG
jgi:hypothetical protein